ncbi:RHS repeat-associated core domain-containing protein [Saccharothrix australiensis]|uniref:Intein/RHS repeat-associated protein n=1 Tax=Saccharothrix australiensis TaxID=2072 RepID=A0A495VSX5_9PSEU|nr:RHS repeat-associated core domain-containing protein [Saccharothrix australiensis]RKT52476.1 intein/RHS repeat-associated protein [Saccharothrix australiensis]
MVLAVFFGAIAPTAIQLWPQLGGGSAGVDPGELAPDQAWGSAEGQPHEVPGETANRALPKSELAKHPQPTFHSDSPRPNEVREVSAPSGLKGFDAATSREDAGQRQANSRTFRNADGTRTTEISQSPMNFRAADGSWQPVDTRLVADGDGWRNAADQVESRFGATASESPFIRVRLSGEHELAFGLAGTRPAAARVDGSAITYPGVAEGVDLRIDAQPGGVKETLVLASPDTAHRWVFPLRLKGLTAKTDDGDVVLTDDAGQEKGRIPAGFMTDSNPENPATSRGVRYEVTGDSLVMALDEAWLRDPARTYPVLVDPSVHGVQANVAVTTSGGKRQSLPELAVGNGSAMYLKFDEVSRTLANHRVFGAQLYLTNFDAPSCRPEPVTVHPITGAWDANGSGHPPTGPELASASFAHGYVALGQSYSACPTAPDAIDLGDAGRDLVQSWVTGGANNGLAVKAVRSWKLFTGAGTANPPRLFVTHTPYNASYRIERGVPEPPVHRQQDGKVRIAVTNRGSQTWTPGAYKLAYRAFTAEGRPVDSREAAALDREVPPGDTITLDATVHRFTNPGDYLLDFSMVHNDTYFTDEQIPPARLSMTMFELPPVVKAQYPPAGHSAPTLTPQLWADAVDVDAPPSTSVLYEFEVCNSRADGTPDPGSCTLGPRAPTKTWTVPSGRMQWSETYHWRAWAVDPSGTRSEALPFSALLTAVPQPDITSHLGGAPYSAGDLDFDPQTGNYTTAAVDIALGVSGPELSVARTYNSLDPRKDLLFGAGWSTRYDMRVVPDQDGSGNVVVTYPDGQQVRFGRNAANGSFDPPAGRFATFYQDVAQPDHNYVLVDKSNTTYTFREFDGRLVTIHDNADRMVDFDYGPTGQLRRVIARTSGNRTLYFTWTGNHVTEVRADSPVAGGAPVKWTYKYVGDRLTEVCDPKSACTKYEYENGSHYRSAVVDSKPDSYWRLGEGSGETAGSQVATNLGKDKGAYRNTRLGAPGALDGTGDTSASFNGTDSYVTLPDGAIKKSRDLSVELWFKTTSGGPLIGFQRAPFDRDPVGSVPVLYVDRDGRLRGQFWHGRIAPITSSGAVNDGNWHHVVLSGSLAVQTLFLDGAKVGTTEGEIDDSLFNHGQIGAAHAVGPADWAPHGWWPGEGKKHFTGQIDEVAIYQHPLGEEAARTHFKARGHADQLTKVSLPSGRTAAQLAYDTTNDRVRDYVDANGGKWKLGLPNVSGTEEQDAQGRTVRNLVRSIEVTDPGNRPHFFDYDPVRGRIIRFVAPLGLGVRLEDRPDPSVVPTTPSTAPPCTRTTTPDGTPDYCGGRGTDNPDWQGGPVQGVGVRTYDYDASGFQQTITDENGHQVELRNDARGNVLSRKTCRAPGVCDTEYYTYHEPAPGKVNDTDPRIDKQKTARDGRSAHADDPTYLTSSEYDTRGELLKQTMPDGTTVVHTYTDGTTAAEGGGNEPAGLLKTTTDARGKKTTYRYYANGDLASTTEPGRTDAEAEGRVTKYRYDRWGRKTSETEYSDSHPAGLETKFVYDERNKPVEVTDAPVTDAITGVKHTKFTKTTYDVDGRPEKVEVSDLTGGDEARTTAYTYDDRGRQDSVTDAQGAKTTYGYDVFGNRTWVVDANGTKIEYAYTARNKVAEVRLRGWHGKPVSGGVGQPETPSDGTLLVLEANTYDLGGRLVRKVDAMGRRTIYEYTPNGLVFRVLAEVPEPGGTSRRIVLEQNEYDGAGNVVKRTGPNGKVTEFTVNAVGRLTEAIADPGGLSRRTAYRYDANGNVTQVARSGNGSNAPGRVLTASSVVDYTYDNVGNQTSETIGSGSTPLTTTRAYDKRGLLVAETDPRGNVAGADPAAYTTEYRYDENERQVAVKLPPVAVETDGGTPTTARPETLVGFDTFGDQVAVKDENGRITRQFHDKVGRVVRTETPDYTAPGASAAVKGVVTTKYDEVGNVVEVVGGRGAVSRFRYDQLGRLVERQDPKSDNATEVGGVWKYTYTHSGEQLSVTDPTGARSEATYDALGRRVTQTTLERKPVPAAYTSTLEYNDAGELKKVTSPSGDVTTSDYDALGQRIRTTDPAGVVVQYGYDGLGRSAWQRDALGRTSYLYYDSAGRLRNQYSLDGQARTLRSSAYTHDEAGNVLSATDAMNRTARYSYDAANRLVQQVEPVSDTESITTSFGYDARGNRTRFTDGRGNGFVTTYNPWSLPESVIEPATAAHPNPADRTWTSVYDVAGNAVKLTAPGGVTRERQYDFLDRLTKETGAGAEAPTAERVRVYDEAGRVKEIDAPGGRNTYDYNDRGALLSAAGPSGTASFGYDGDGRITSRTDAAGTTGFAYDKGRLKTVSDGLSGVGLTFGYNEAGQLKTLQYGASRTRTFDYDALGRQKSDVVKDPAGAVVSSLAYEYDDNDRLTRKVASGLAGSGDHTYTYDYANRLKSWTVGGQTTEYGWDASGNRTRHGAKTATYDERNRLLADGDYTYAYTARGSMASRTSSGLAEKFSFDAFDRLIEVGATKYAYDGADRVVTRGAKSFAYAGFDIDPVSDGDTSYGRGPSGELLSLDQGGQKRLALADKHGDVVGGMAPAGTGIADSTAYDPFGVVTGSTGERRQVGFQGDWTDPSTGLVNMGARWYAPGTGGFASRDSVSAEHGPAVLFNRYTYGAGRPLDLVDPDGHWPDWGGIWNGVKKAASVAVDVVKEVSGYNDIANFIREPSWGNFFWAASNFVPFGKLAKGAKYLFKYGDDLLGAGRRGGRYADDAAGAGRYADDVAGGARKYGDNLAGAARRNAADFGKAAAREAAQSAARRAAAAAAAAAARRAAMEAVTKRAKAAIAHAAKNNPLPVLQAVLKPRIALKDLVSSAPNLPARQVSALAENVQDVNKVWETVKATIIKPGTNVVQSVGEQVVSDFANSQVPGVGDLLGLLGPSRKRGNGAARDSGDRARGEVNGTCPVSLDRNSFSGDTPVLMADGSLKPIKDVRVGDEVVATDPTTGERGVRTVTDTRSHESERLNYRITIRTDAGTDTVVATDEHPFWVESLQRWVDAEDLRPGYAFETADHRPATVIGSTSFGDALRVHNLTVDGLHTYHVGVANVLVHNEDPAVCVPSKRGEGPSRQPVIDVEEAPAGWSQAERLQLAINRLPAYALFNRSSKASGRSYIGAINLETGAIALASSGCHYCAEGNALLALGGDPSKVLFTQALQVHAEGEIFTTQVKDVCKPCQIDYPDPGNFVPGTRGVPGGVWDRRSGR